MKPLELRSKNRGHRLKKQLPLADRFAAKWEADEKTGCWLWCGTLQKNGYGRFKMPGRMAFAHRASWELKHGAIPSGMFVMHRCDTPACVNPEHLRLGTHAENMADMREKGRQNKGTKQHAATLTEPMVYGVRAMLKHGASQEECSIIFGVSRSAIQAVGTRATWTHLPDAESGLLAALRGLKSTGNFADLEPEEQDELIDDALEKFGGAS